MGNRTEMELFFRRMRSECRRALRDGTVAKGCEELMGEFVHLLGEAAEVENELPGQGYEVIREAAKDTLEGDGDQCDGS